MLIGSWGELSAEIRGKVFFYTAQGKWVAWAGLEGGLG